MTKVRAEGARTTSHKQGWCARSFWRGTKALSACSPLAKQSMGRWEVGVAAALLPASYLSFTSFSVCRRERRGTHCHKQDCRDCSGRRPRCSPGAGFSHT